jgi:transposase
MFIKRTTKLSGGKTYVNHLLVESVLTAKGPRHKVVCSLGPLAPAEPAEWLALAHRLEAALAGQKSIQPDPTVESIVAKTKPRKHESPKTPAPALVPPTQPAADVAAVHIDRISLQDAREAGPVHVAHQMWQRLGLDDVLHSAGLSPRARLLSEVMTVNRLVASLSEHAMPDWIRRTALADILHTSFDSLADEALYRNLDRLHPKRELIETRLAERERTLFNLDDSIYLYDLTSTYFEGQCPRNPQAKLGYSRDSRPDCKQVVVGLVIDREGFPKAHQVLDGNMVDRKTVVGMLAALEKRVGRRAGGTVVVDRGMAFDDNLQQIRTAGYHYIVASRQGERLDHVEDFEDASGFVEVIREVSPNNPAQKKSRVRIKRRVVGDEMHILCCSEGREKKDRAIREKHEQRLLADLAKLKARIDEGRLVDEAKIREAIGRLKERYSRVGRYYLISYQPDTHALTWQENADRKDTAKLLDGGYLLKTDRQDLSDEEVWKTYSLLTRVEAAFRSMKSPLAERPIFHHLETRVQTHIFLCVLAYHLLVAVEKTLRDSGLYTSWGTVREQLATHQVVTVNLPTTEGNTISIRRSTTPEGEHNDIYRRLGIPAEIIKPVRTVRPSIVTQAQANVALSRD